MGLHAESIFWSREKQRTARLEIRDSGARHKFPESARPCGNDLFGFVRIVFHPCAPDQFFGTNGADSGGKARGGPCDGGETVNTAVSGGVILWHIFGFFIASGRLSEPGPDMSNNPIVAGQFRARCLLDRLADFAGNFGGCSNARAICLSPGRIPRPYPWDL